MSAARVRFIIILVLAILWVGWILFAMSRVPPSTEVDVLWHDAAATCKVLPMSPRGGFICGSKRCVDSQKIT